MFDVKSRVQAVRWGDGHEDDLIVYSRDIDGYSPLKVEAGANAIKGSWGAAHIRIDGYLSSLIEVHKHKPTEEYLNKGIEITLRGSERVESAVKALEFILQALRDGQNMLNE